MTEPGDITRLLSRMNRGETEALDALLPLVTEELRRIAGRVMRGERPDHTLQPTALVHELYLSLLSGDRLSFRDRVHFFAVAARCMRRFLVDHARARRTAKRGGARRRTSLDGGALLGTAPQLDLIDLDDALGRLAELDPRQSRLVELRFFAGLTLAEAAEALDLSIATASRDWSSARAWLHRELTS